MLRIPICQRTRYAKRRTTSKDHEKRSEGHFTKTPLQRTKRTWRLRQCNRTDATCDIKAMHVLAFPKECAMLALFGDPACKVEFIDGYAAKSL